MDHNVQSLAENMKELGIPMELLESAGKPPERRPRGRGRSEDVQTSGHGTSYPSPGAEIETGIRNPDDGDETDPDRVTGESRRLRTSSLRGEGRGRRHREDDGGRDADPDQDPDRDQDRSRDEGDRDPDARDGAEASAIERDREEPPADSRRGERGDREESDPLPPRDDDDSDLPPEKVKVGEVTLRRPTAKAEVREARRLGLRRVKAISESLARDPGVMEARQRRSRAIGNILSERRMSTGGSKADEIRRLVEATREPTTSVEDYVTAFSAMADLDEAMACKFAELHGDYAPVKAWGPDDLFKRLGEACLTRAVDSCEVLRELRTVKGPLGTRQRNVVESTLAALGKEQMRYFGCLGDVLASVGLHEDMEDLPGVDDMDDEDDDAVVTQGDAPEEGRRARRESDDDDLDVDSLSADEAREAYARTERRMQKLKKRMGEDGRMPTDRVGEDDAETVTPDLPHEGRAPRPRTAPRRR